MIDMMSHRFSGAVYEKTWNGFFGDGRARQLGPSGGSPDHKGAGRGSASELLRQPLDLFEFKPRGLPLELRGLHHLCDDRRRPRLLNQRRGLEPDVFQWRLQFRWQAE